MTTQITVTTTAVKLPFGPPYQPVLQNLGSGNLFFGPTSAVTPANGIRLSNGLGYEFPNRLQDIPQWPEVWVISDGTSDLRIMNVG